MPSHATLTPEKALRSSDRVPTGRLYISNEGDAISPDGPHGQLSTVICKVLDRRADAKDRGKALRALREFTAFELTPGEPWDAFIHESDDDGERRIRTWLERLGCTVTKIPLDGTFEVVSPSITYVRAKMVAIRQFYAELCERLHAPDSPADVKGWRTMQTRAKIAWAKAHNYHPIYGMEHAGHRFFARDTPAKPRMLYDPYDTVDRLTAALKEVGAPQIVRDVAAIARVNGLRFEDFAGGSAYGYALAGLGDHFKCRDKRGGDALTKNAAMPSDVQERVRGRFEALPHPHDPDRTLWDRVVELAPRLALAGGEGLAAADELRGYLLLGRSGVRSRVLYDGFRYWLRCAGLDGDVVVQTTEGPWIASSRVFRKAAIGGAVKELFARTKDKAERKEGIKEISDRFGQKTDQTQAYADWEYELDAVRARLEQAKRRENEAAAARLGSAAPIRSGRLGAAAQNALDRLSDRPSAA